MLFHQNMGEGKAFTSGHNLLWLTLPSQLLSEQPRIKTVWQILILQETINLEKISFC